MQKQFKDFHGMFADEIKGQLHTLSREMKEEMKKNIDQPQSGDLRELKMPNNLQFPGQMALPPAQLAQLAQMQQMQQLAQMPVPQHDPSIGTPRTLSRNLMAEAQKAKEAQESAEAAQRAATEAAQRAEAATQQIEMQKRTEEELHHKLMQQERVHDRTIKEVVSQTHSREAELKMLVKSQAVRLEQMQYQLKTDSRETTNTGYGPDGRQFPDREGSAQSQSSSITECFGSRDRCGPGPSDRPPRMVDNLASPGPPGHPSYPPGQPRGYGGGDYR